MADANWTDRIVGERMQLDREFNDRVAASEFSSQQWGLIMTAVEFEIENPGDDETARLVADTSNLPSIMSELDRVDQARGPAPGGGSGGGSGGGLFDGVKDALGLGGGGNDEQLQAAERLAQEYADELQAKLEERGKWESVRDAAQRG